MEINRNVSINMFYSIVAALFLIKLFKKFIYYPSKHYFNNSKTKMRSNVIVCSNPIFVKNQYCMCRFFKQHFAFYAHILDTIFEPVFPANFVANRRVPKFFLNNRAQSSKKTFITLNFTPIQYLSILNVIFPQICRIFQSYVYYIAYIICPCSNKSLIR